MMKHKIISTLTTLLIAVSTSVTSMAAENIAAADSAYVEGRYADAIEIYNEVARKEGVSSELFYNMGNAYAKGGDNGHAVMYYLRALRLDPSNSEAAANAKYIENKVADNNRAEFKGRKYSVDPESPSFFQSVRLHISRDRLSDTWAVWAAVFFVAFVICLAMYIFSSAIIVRKTGFFGGIVTLGLSMVMLIFSFMAASYRSDEGVITQGKVKLLSEASTSAKEGPVALTRGTRMTILDSIPVGEGKAKWYKVRLNSDFVGWIASDDFEPVGY